MKKIFFIVCVICISMACTTSKKINPESNSFEVFFGNFGGFANSSTEYVISDSGLISKIENNSHISLRKLRRKQVQKIKEQIKSIGFENLKINEPGNLTYFIKVKTANYENTVKWSDETQNTELKNTYKMLFESLQ